MRFVDFFTPIYFPVDHSPQKKEERLCLTTLPTPLLSAKQIEEDAGKLLLANAASRNIIVYDYMAKPKVLSLTLLVNMCKTYNRMHNQKYKGKLTDIVVSETITNQTVLDYINNKNIRMHKIKMSEEIKFLTQTCRFKLPSNKKKVILGINTNMYRLVMPVNEDKTKYGIHVVNNDALLLGVY